MIEFILILILSVLSAFFLPFWKAVVCIALLMLLYFAVEWFMDYDWRGK
jgi:hypothetical protein